MATLNDSTTQHMQPPTSVSLGSRMEPATCNYHGAYSAAVVSVFGERVIREPCPTCIAERKAREAAQRTRREAAERQARIDAMIGRAGIPPRFRDHGFETYRPETPEADRVLRICKAYAERFEERLLVGGCLILCGYAGTGKTHLACAIANHVMHALEKTAAFITVMDAVRSVQETYGKNSETTTRQAIARLAEPDLLILDEVGAQLGTEHEKQVLFDVINRRYEQMRPTILISNLDAPGLTTFVGERVMSRMQESGGAVLGFTWNDYRGKQQ